LIQRHEKSAPARGGWWGGGVGREGGGGRERQRERERERERECERERELALAPLFICLSLRGPVLCKLGQPGV